MKQNVYVSYIVSLDEFYVQFVIGLDKLIYLSEEMNRFYFLYLLKNELKKLIKGMFCCVKFSQDYGWYRGIVKGVVLYGVEVEFVDYGNCEFVNFIDVKDVEKVFMQLF